MSLDSEPDYSHLHMSDHEREQLKRELHENAGGGAALDAYDASQQHGTEPERVVFQDVRIRTRGGTDFHAMEAEQDEMGWWFDGWGRPTFVPHHSVDYVQFTEAGA